MRLMSGGRYECPYPQDTRRNVLLLQEELQRLKPEEAASLLRYEQYQYKGTNCSPALVRGYKNLLVNGVARHQRSTCSMATVWLRDDSQLAISQLVDHIRESFKANPIKDGMRDGQQRYRSRGDVLVKWRREQKLPSATDSFSDSGIHYHIAVLWCAKRSNKRFLHAIFKDAVQKGIVRAPTSVCREPYRITGEHDLSSEEGLLAAADHVVRYCSKLQTSISNGLRQTGGTILQPLYK